MPNLSIDVTYAYSIDIGSEIRSLSFQPFVIGVQLFDEHGDVYRAQRDFPGALLRAGKELVPRRGQAHRQVLLLL